MITPASIQDIPSLLLLLNNAYRGEESKKGWTTEADLLLGEQRTDEVSLLKLFNTPNAVFLKYEEDGKIKGCVFLHKKEKRLYLGMLSVSPVLQGKGIGRQLLDAAAIHAKQQGCDSIYMTVISVRHELIAWYERHGYRDTGERQPFPVDHNFGEPTQTLEFCILEKQIS
jgi:ribosomal protein S18 acetylase RimI-like enzyme